MKKNNFTHEKGILTSHTPPPQFFPMVEMHDYTGLVLDTY